MIKKVLLFLLCATPLVSCGRPPISSGDFADICHDMFIVHFYVDDNPGIRFATDSLSVYGAVLEKYGYSVEDYRSTVDYYVSNPEDYARILKDVQRRINGEKKALGQKIKSENESASLSVPDVEMLVTDENCPSLDFTISQEILRKIFP